MNNEADSRLTHFRPPECGKNSVAPRSLATEWLPSGFRATSNRGIVLDCPTLDAIDCKN